MNEGPHLRIKQYSIITSQELGILKAQDIGINLDPSIYETGLWDNPNPTIQKLNRFGDKYLDIFGDHSQLYIYSLEHPFDIDNFFTIKYNYNNIHLCSDGEGDVMYGFKAAIGYVLYEVERKNQSFSNIETTESKAVFYVGNEVFAEVTKTQFSEVDTSSIKECTTLLKGIHTGRDFIEENNYRRLAKFPGLENYRGHQVEIDGEFINPTISNFVKGFKWLVESFTDDEVSLSDAEKIMWAFYGIENEHPLRANEKNLSIIKKPYFLEVYEEGSDEEYSTVKETLIYRSFTEALVGFRDKIKELNIERPFIFNKGYFNSLITIDELPKGEDLVGNSLLRLGSYSYTSKSEAKEYIDKANELFGGEIEFSQKEDKIVKVVSVNNTKIRIYNINGIFHVEDRYQNMITLRSLIISPPEGVRTKNMETGEDTVKYGRNWNIKLSKYDKPTNTSVFRLGEIDKEDISMLVKELQIPVYYHLLDLTLDEEVFYFKLNKDNCPGY